MSIFEQESVSYARPQTLAFIDESGDPGFKLDKGSSQFFSVALVLFHNPEAARLATQQIKALKDKMGFPQKVEFKYTKLNDVHSRRVFEGLSSIDFQFCSVIIDKQNLLKQGLNNKLTLFEYTVELTIKLAKPYLHDACIVIDGDNQKDFRTYLGNKLKRTTNEGKEHRITKVRTQDSASNDLLQLADLVVGAVHANQKSKPGAARNLELINGKQLGIQICS
jgi:hypothetical protein